MNSLPRRVSGRLEDQGVEIPAGLIQGSAATGKQHRIITLGFSWGDEQELAAIAAAAAAELSENTELYFRQLGTDGAGVTLLDGPNIGPVTPGLRARLELPLRLLLAFLAGIFLLFLLEYLDTSVRSRQELEEMGIPVLGAIPRHRR